MKGHYNKEYSLLIISLSGGLVVLSIMAISLGRYSMNPMDVMRVIVEALNSSSFTDPAMYTVLFVLRIPRILAAILIGASLSLAGAVYQGVFKNPLVSPDLLGVSSGATVGAAIAILMGSNFFMIQLFSFLIGLLAVGISATIPRLLRNESNLALVLSGIITSGFMSSICGVLKFVADPETQLAGIVFWQMGSVATVNRTQIFTVSPLLIGGSIFLLALSWRINILSFGEEEAKTLGMNVKIFRGITIACASLLTASAVSISGTIGWIGLVIPHLGRLLAGSDNSKLIPTTILLGGLFLLTIDTLSRIITSVEIPLSILTGFFGAPFYAWLLWKQRMNIQ